MTTKVVGWGPWRLLGESGRVRRAAESAERLMESADPRVESQPLEGGVEALASSAQARTTDSGARTTGGRSAVQDIGVEVATVSGERGSLRITRRQDDSPPPATHEAFKHVGVRSAGVEGEVLRDGELELSEVFDVLRADPSDQQMNWSARYKDNLEKLHSGDPMRVAEVVRDLYHRQRDRGLSAGEERMLIKARQVLVSQLALAQRTDEFQAEASLARVLAIVG